MSTPNKKTGTPAASSSGNRLSKRHKPNSNTPSKAFDLSKNAIQFLHIANAARSGNAPSCLMITAEGYMERALTGPFYQRESNSYYKRYMDDIAPYQLVVNPIDKNGNVRMRPNTSKNRRPTDPEYYPEKAILIEVANDATWEDDMKPFFEDTLKPCIEALEHTPIFKYRPDVKMASPPVIETKYWSDVLDTATISNVLKDFYCESEGVTLSEFLKMDKENIYSVWPEGKVPLEEIIIFHNLTQEHLAPLDCDRYTEYQKGLKQDMSSDGSPRRDLGHDMEQASS